MNASNAHQTKAGCKRALRKPSIWQRLSPTVFACLATLLALPAQAQVVIPEEPLQSGVGYPDPNLMFILDNSGSMASVSMPACNVDPEYSGTSVGCSGTLSDSANERSYLNNTIYYDPNVVYRPWMMADGATRMTGGTDVTEVFKSWNLASDAGGTRDLRDSSESIFYVPKTGVTNSTDENDFDRYQIRNVGGVAKVMRGSGNAITLASGNWNNEDISAYQWWYQSFTVPANATSLEVVADDGSDGDPDLYVRFGAQPTTGNYDASDTGGNRDVTISNPQAGTWYIGIYNDDNDDINNKDIDYTVEGQDWEEATPTGRSQAAELENIATWYSYFRTRMKSAKAGASEAFASLGSGYRVGYTPINGRSDDLDSDGTGTIIPVDVNEGRFEGTNKTDWYSVMQNEVVQDGSTPLRTALNAVGQYYTRTDANGPWGDGTDAAQLSCRPSFSILTTDGYWNDSTSATFGLGDEDGDGHSVTLADIADYYYGHDLRNDLDNNVPTSTADPADWQHMVTFGLSIGLQGNMTITDPPPASDADAWTNPMNGENEDRIDDLWHASVNGHGEFVAASNPTEFAQGLLDALNSVAVRTGSASNVTANSTSLQTSTRLYQASYASGLWTGELEAFDVSDAGISETPEWQASQQIPAYPDRKIWTMSGGTGAGFVTTVSGNSALARTTGLAQVSSADNAAYLAGDQSNEKTNDGVLRNRFTVLGDIANSSPFYVDTTNSIYVGANDGMLHAFATVASGNGGNAIAAGQELFAYVPAGIDLAALATLSDPQYSGAHKYFVDGPLVVSTTTQTPGNNYLVGSLGRGGKGVFGLDVTDPDSFGASDVLWDNTFTVNGTAPTGYTNMGQVLGDPLVVTLNNDVEAVIVGNGINSGNGGTTATASLFIIDIDTGAVIKELNTGVVGDNGLSAPRGADLNGDRKVDTVYAGDLKGNVWKFDLSDANSDNWAIANSGSPMFVAMDSDDKRQPITTGLALAQDPATDNIWVFVGTGSFMTLADVSNNDVQSMYGLIDSGTVITRDELDQQLIASTTVIDLNPDPDVTENREVRAFEKNQPSLDGTKKGWYIDLDDPEAGERIVSNPRVDGGVLVTTSIIPPTENTCDAGGTGYINAVSAFTGTATEFPYFDANGDGTIDQDDTITVTNADGTTTQVPVGSLGTDAMPSQLIRVGSRYYYGLSDGGSEDEEFNPQGALARRTSWREIRGG